MKPTQTGIAVALALIVVAVFFIFPGLWPFGTTASSAEQAAALSGATSTDTTTQSSTTTMAATPTQLEITDEVVGTGEEAKAGDTVTVNYVGALLNGTVFDASANHPETKDGFSFVLGAGNVIKGWDEGVAGMKVGGTRKLVIPADMAYGARANGPIPANSPLMFEVQLLKVQKGGQ